MLARVNLANVWSAGAFRTACEVTMQLLRDNYGSLISVLDAFVHDPLVEWEDQRRKNVSRMVLALYRYV